jgi:hypothetical protein
MQTELEQERNIRLDLTYEELKLLNSGILTLCPPCLDLTYEELKRLGMVNDWASDWCLDLTYEELMLVVTFHMMSDGRT